MDVKFYFEPCQKGQEVILFSGQLLGTGVKCHAKKIIRQTPQDFIEVGGDPSSKGSAAGLCKMLSSDNRASSPHYVLGQKIIEL